MGALVSVGAQVAGYRLEELVGRGGMGVVYRAYDIALDRSVALKLLAPELAADRAFRERFLIESRLAASLDHPNVVPIHDAGEVEGQLYIAMRYVEGSDLKRLLEGGPLESGRALAICSQVAAALDAAHARGLVHRDVKPSNILLDEHEHVYLADFGLTRRLGEAGVPLGAALSLGTPAYVAPEQIRGDDVDGRADVYSLGCLLHECLTGGPPFTGSEVEVLYGHLEQPPPAVAGLEQVLSRALAKSPAERYTSCRELIGAARPALGLDRPRRDRRVLALAAAGTVLIGAALLAFFLTQGGSPVPPSGSLVRVDPRTGRVSGTVRVGRQPTGVAVAGGRVWVTTFADSSVWRVDAASLDALRIAAHGSPIGIAAAGGTAYVANSLAGNYGDPGNVTRIGAATGVTTDVVQTGGAYAVATGPGGVWAATPQGAARLGSVSTFTGKVEERARIPGYTTPGGVAVGSGAVWIVGDALVPKLWRIDPATGRVVATIGLPFVPDSVAAGFGAVWVAAQLEDAVARIDPRTNRVVATIRVGREPIAVAAGEGAVWTANAIDGTLTRIDPAHNRAVAVVRVGGSPQAVAAGSGSVWVGADAG